jgi:hypothetical protein
MIVELNFPGCIKACAKAAAKSYGKNVDSMSEEEQFDYVCKIWDKHTNISEHFVFSLDLLGVPRIVTFIMSMQRHGFSMTEFSQRRRKPAGSYPEYEARLAAGERKEDARKCLPVTVESDVTVTLNREAARNIARIIRKFRRNDYFKDILNETQIDSLLSAYGIFSLDDEEPFCCPEVVDEVRAPKNEFEEVITCPLYAATQLVRHRTLDILELAGLPPQKLGQNIALLLRSFHWKTMAQTRSRSSTQEPLRTIARQLLDK